MNKTNSFLTSFLCKVTNPFNLSQHKSQKVKLTMVSQLHHYDLQTLVPGSKHLQYQFSTENQVNKEQT